MFKSNGTKANKKKGLKDEKNQENQK